jgi:type IV fimbrial biogenesis protein FimT
VRKIYPAFFAPRLPNVLDIAGFTLIEFVLVLSLIAVLITLAIPTYQKWIAQHRAMTQVNRLVTAIQFARSEAVKRHVVVTVCPSSNGQNCTEKWRDGWIIFTDAKATGKFKSGDQILRVYNAISASDQLEWRALRSNQYLQLSPMGGTNGQQGTFIYYSSINKIATQIVISQTGRIRINET